jgi:sugar phosphate isomerase/epimerase
MSVDLPLTGIRPILAVVLPNGERLIVARLTNLGGSSQSNRFVLRRADFRPPWPQPDKGYFGYAEVARALDANGWRGCAIEAMPSTDPEERRARQLARKKLHMQCVDAAIRRVQDGPG